VTGYTVIDVETTGLSPETHDRIVEIGVVYVSDQGEIQDHWSTLVNPKRDVGPTRIHGITATDVTAAPTFAELAPYVLRAVEGRTIVAHNAMFDLRFLAHEIARTGLTLDPLPLDGVCTMAWSTAYLNAPSRRLVDCCRAGGITLTNSHSAAGDALATAQLLSHYLKTSGFNPPWVDTVHSSRKYAWPPYTGEYPELRMTRRSQVASARADEWLDRIVSKMPRASDARVDSYLALLEMAMLDGVLAEHEKDQLVTAAMYAGLTRGQVLDLHGDYLRAMAEVALEDGVVTPAERGTLTQAANLLGLRATDVAAALEVASTESGGAQRMLASAALSLEPGDRVVFTGDMIRDRGEWEEIARRHGLQPGGVTKATKLVVAADPNSLSGKAAKARSYGIPIITEAAFAQLLAAAGT
jgi:DNA polymerase-3 subunit epsilon